MRRSSLLLALLAPFALHAAATITIVNGDPSGIGFNDPTPADPVGGNTGATIGQQRLNAFQSAADKWGATLNSNIPIRVLATWEALACTPSSAVLGGASATEIFRDFKGAPKSGTWYSKAQTDAIMGVDMDPTSADIHASFNINLGSPGCFDGTYFYLGLDNNHGSNIDLVSVLIHEFGHGLGFQTFTDGYSGQQIGGFPSAWDSFLLDTTTGLTWDKMTDAQRAASATRNGKLVWNGSKVNSAAAKLLAPGTPTLQIVQPDPVTGNYAVGPATFGPALSSPGVSGAVVTPADSLACDPLSPADAATVAGNIALVDRGVCPFVTKALNLQAAGAIGMIVADNVAGSPPPALGGIDSTVAIPAVRITQADGVALKAALSSALAPVLATLGTNPNQLQGVDSNGFVLMYAPSPYQPGSSVSHFDGSAFPNLLMEPTISADLTHDVDAPKDLTYLLLRDIGWP